jgi:hypothetical protein
VRASIAEAGLVPARFGLLSASNEDNSDTPDNSTPMRPLYIATFNGKDWDIFNKPVTE